MESTLCPPTELEGAQRELVEAKARVGTKQVHVTEHQNMVEGLKGKVWAARELLPEWHGTKRQAAGDARAPERTCDAARIEELQEDLKRQKRFGKECADRAVALDMRLEREEERGAYKLARAENAHRITKEQYSALTRALVAALEVGHVGTPPAVADIQNPAQLTADDLSRACSDPYYKLLKAMAGEDKTAGPLVEMVQRETSHGELEAAAVALVAAAARTLRLTAQLCPGVWLERDPQGHLVYSHDVAAPKDFVMTELKNQQAASFIYANTENMEQMRATRALARALHAVFNKLDARDLTERVRSELIRGSP